MLSFDKRTPYLENMVIATAQSMVTFTFVEIENYINSSTHQSVLMQNLQVSAKKLQMHIQFILHLHHTNDSKYAT